MATVIDTLNKQGEYGKMITPLFISIDPQRDTVAKIREYVNDFHPSFVGLTGTPQQVEKLCKLYRVYFSKANEQDEDYLLDHSIIIYLMDTNGDFLDFFGSNMNEDQITVRTQNHLKKFIDEQLPNSSINKPWYKKLF